MFKTGYVYKKDNAKLKLHTYMGPALPPPPREVDWTLAISEPLGMMGNDMVGDCTCADIGHIILLQTANGSGIFIPSDNDVLSFYSAVSGYVPGDPNTDAGASLSEAAAYARRVGMAGHKIRGALDVDFSKPDSIKQSIYLFKNCAFGVNLPQSAEDDFGKPIWGNTSDTRIIGGHDVPGVAYDDEGVVLITWGGYQKATWAWLATYCVEAQARLYEDAVESDYGMDPNGFKMADLERDLGIVGA
jgi:hypothetical protein